MGNLLKTAKQHRKYLNNHIIHIISAVSTEISMVLALVFAVILFSAMQIYRPLLVESKLSTIFGGFAGSWLFILSLTVKTQTLH